MRQQHVKTGREECREGLNCPGKYAEGTCEI